MNGCISSLLLITTVVISACAAPSAERDAAALGDSSASITRRVAAASRLGKRGDAASLRRAVWARHDMPAAVRGAALDAWLQSDEDAVWRELDAKVVRLDTPAVAVLAERAVAEGRQDAVPGLLRAWAQPSHVAEADRPEGEAISRLVEELPLDLFLIHTVIRRPVPGIRTTLSHEVAAWTVLMRRDRRMALTALEMGPQPPTELTKPLRDVLDHFGPLPTNRHEVLALWRVHATPVWRAAVERAADLSDRKRASIELRHLPVLVTAEGADAASLKPLHAEPLTWADAATVEVLRAAVSHRRVVSDLFEKADADHADTGSEHGGLLMWNAEDGYTFRDYPPARRGRDREYVAPRDLVTDLPTAIAHYHFHATDWNNADAARAGLGDRRLADRLRFNGLLFTPLDRDTLRATFYGPDGVEVHLLDLHRPEEDSRGGAEARG